MNIVGQAICHITNWHFGKKQLRTNNMVLKTFADGMIKFTIHNWHFKQTKKYINNMAAASGYTEGAIPLNQTNVHMFYIKIRFTCKKKKRVK